MSKYKEALQDIRLLLDKEYLCESEVSETYSQEEKDADDNALKQVMINNILANVGV